jgi:formylglycine-generating enzyme required for sulfatase activity
LAAGFTGAARIWALNQLPALEKLANDQRYFEAYELAACVKKYLPDDARLAKLMPSISDIILVTTELPGARVYLKRFTPDETAPRQFGGTTPINNLAIARGEYLMSVEKEGYAPFERTISDVLTLSGNTLVPPEEPSDFKIKLIETARLPHRMVFVPGGQYKLASRSRPTEARAELDDYFIDKYEVTNREFKEFISAGGYFKPEFWKQPYHGDRREIIGSEAIEQSGQQARRNS